jgi:hypothetical protein
MGFASTWRRFCLMGIHGFLGALALLTLVPPAPVGATTLSVALDLQGQGLTLAQGGVGLETLGAGTANINVNIGGPVQGALLYWAGRDVGCPQSGGTCVVPFQPYKDQVLTFQGNLITGTIIGTEAEPIPSVDPATQTINNIGYLADVTSIVQAAGTGPQTFTIQDGNLGSNLYRLSGATLVVIYTNPADTTIYRLIVHDGLDFAFGPHGATPAGMTTAVTFNHGALGVARSAELLLSVGGGTAARPDRVDISNNPSVFNTLDGSRGASWDADQFLINVPAGVASTTVQVFSEPVASSPDALLWQVAALRVALPVVPSSTPTSTLTSTPTATSTLAATSTPTATLTPTVTATPSITPTLLPNVTSATASCQQTENPNGTSPWTNPAGAAPNDGPSFASNALNGIATEYLQCDMFQLAIPDGATITGVEVLVSRRANAPMRVRDGSVRLIQGGLLSPSEFGGGLVPAGPGFTEVAFGGPSQTWGYASITEANVESSTFGVLYSARRISTSPSTIDVESIRVRVYYT